MMLNRRLRSHCAPRSDVMQKALVHALLALALTFGAVPVLAQQSSETTSRNIITSPILTIDSDRVFSQSAFGRRVASEIEAEGNKLAAENRKIEADLESEERELTEMRATMEAEAFRARADAFDEKVQKIREAQAAKGRALTDLLEEERAVFLNAAAPVLEQLMRDAGAAVILERRSVFVSASAVEITDDAISLLNETLGSGSQPVKP